RLPERIKADMAAQLADGRVGQLSTYTCPECGGSMWQADDNNLTRFRCHTGHVYYGEDLLEEQSEALEAALWTAVRTFKEKTLLGRQLAMLARERGEGDVAIRFDEDAQLAERYAALIQEHVLGAGPPGSRSNGGAEETNVPVPPTAAAASEDRAMKQTPDPLALDDPLTRLHRLARELNGAWQPGQRAELNAIV